VNSDSPQVLEQVNHARDEAIFALCGTMNTHVTPITGGGNSTIFCLEAEHDIFALKQYRSEPNCQRDRQHTEIRALDFLNECKMKRIPRHIASHGNFSLLSWIDGKKIVEPTETDIIQSIELLVELQSYSDTAHAKKIPSAFDPCVSLDAFVEQLSARYHELDIAVADDAGLSFFLQGDLRRAFVEMKQRAYSLYQRAGLTFEEIPFHEQRLIHGDFGLHNMLKSDEGLLYLIDFEYFGWDDPVRMIADFALHPGVSLSVSRQTFYLQEIHKRFVDRQDALQRLSALFPLLAIRWALIVLNVFLPHRWNLRDSPRSGVLWNTIKDQQLAKASSLLTLCRREGI